jgi:hypothetical protein
MGTRGRKSAAESAIVIVGAFGTRPEPPADVTPRQAEIWRETVSSEHSEFFNTAALRALLLDYCRHRESAENVSQIINTFQAEWLKSQEGSKRYHGLLKMRDLETRAAAQIATKLRLTNQSRYTPQAAATAAKSAGSRQKPWEI